MAVLTLVASACDADGGVEFRDEALPGDPQGGGGFIPSPDVGGSIFECDLFTQNCGPGDKCMPWANDGGGAWNATRCSLVADQPSAPGEPCVANGSGVSGDDDCERGAMCWNVDAETGQGVCAAMLLGSLDEPRCANPLDVPSISGGGVLSLCLPGCDPIAQDCGPNEACYANFDGTNCAPDVSGDLGGVGEPCEFINVCDPGLWCVNPNAVPYETCEGAGGCCTPVCDLNAPVCPQDTVCTPHYDEGSAPPGQQDVGVCYSPA